MKNINWNDVQEATERRDLPVGGYVAGICKATDEPAKERLNIEWEVAEGEFKGYWREQTASLIERGKLNPGEWAWGGKTIKSYKEKALPFFKGFITAVSSPIPVISSITMKRPCVASWSVWFSVRKNTWVTMGTSRRSLSLTVSPVLTRFVPVTMRSDRRKRWLVGLVLRLIPATLP